MFGLLDAPAKSREMNNSIPRPATRPATRLRGWRGSRDKKTFCRRILLFTVLKGQNPYTCLVSSINYTKDSGTVNQVLGYGKS